MKYHKMRWGGESEYRNEIYGLSIISIMIFHYFEDVFHSELYANTLKNVCDIYFILIRSIGVEIFFFMSGVCLYYSLKKNNNLKEFYAKRFKRILCPYIIYGGLFWFIKDVIILKESIFDFLYDFSLLSFWFNGEKILWYIAVILFVYIIYPFIFSFFYKGDGDWQSRFIKLILSLGILIAFNMFINFFFNDVYMNLEIGLNRMVVVLFGSYYAEKIYSNNYFNKFDILLFVSGIALKMFSLFFFYENTILFKICNNRIMNCISAISYIIILCLIFNKVFDKNKCCGFRKALRTMGRCSLELYLTHVTIRSMFKLLNLNTSNIIIYGICILVSLILSFALKKLTNYVNSLNS